MLHETNDVPPAHLETVLTGLTQVEKDWLRDQGAAPDDDAEALAALAAVAGIARRAIRQLDDGQTLDGRTPGDQAYDLRMVCRYLQDLTTGHEAQAGLDAYEAWAAWKLTAGEWASFKDLADRLRRLLLTKDATAPRAAAPKAAGKKSNADILAEELTKRLGRPAPKGREARVKAVLVLGGRAYTGANSGGGLLHVTYDLIRPRVTRMEDWSATGCAEAYALDQWVYQNGFATADAAYEALCGTRATFKDGRIAAMDARTVHGSTGRFWVKRMPCENCQQWLKALGITADRTLNFS
ncbi:hypothetical protein [Kitasatospora terrestris]|uniref:CMP/dCMP-type deaminase domain-containing protein n=1 Tax=Kitasatospora terrestris TaxID=258051 RepID=A0ABP9EHK1_9ACTN